jgi:hypothetical protein
MSIVIVFLRLKLHLYTNQEFWNTRLFQILRYANKTEDDILLRTELDEIERVEVERSEVSFQRKSSKEKLEKSMNAGSGSSAEEEMVLRKEQVGRFMVRIVVDVKVVYGEDYYRCQSREDCHRCQRNVEN